MDRHLGVRSVAFTVNLVLRDFHWTKYIWKSGKLVVEVVLKRNFWPDAPLLKRNTFVLGYCVYFTLESHLPERTRGQQRAAGSLELESHQRVVFQTISNSTVCSTECEGEQQSTSKHHWPFGEGNSPMTGGVSSQRASNAQIVSMLWRHCDITGHRWIHPRKTSNTESVSMLWSRYVSKSKNPINHCSDVIMRAMASQITSISIFYSTVYSGTDQRKHQSSASLAFVRGIHRGPVNSPHKRPITRKLFHLMTSSCHAPMIRKAFPCHDLVM